MTREEAIQYLEWLSDIDFTKKYPKYTVVTKQEQVEALQMAVEALKAKDLDEQLWILNEFSTFDLRESTINLVLNANFEKKMALLDEMVEPKMDVTDTNVDDMVYRQAAIDAAEESRRLNHHQDGKEACAHEYEHRHFLKLLRALPSAQPETAKRIVGKSRGGMTLWYQCDMCNEPVDAQDNFCRGCGRRLTDG